MVPIDIKETETLLEFQKNLNDMFWNTALIDF